MSRRSRSPVETRDDRRLDLERVHERDRVDGERRLLAVAERLIREEPRRAEAAHVGNKHAIARRRQQRRDIGVAVDVVRPAVQQDDRRTVGGTEVDVADVQEAGVDLLHRAERGGGLGWLWRGLEGHATVPATAADPTDATASRITSVTA